jgi:hypothetical protein
MNCGLAPTKSMSLLYLMVYGPPACAFRCRNCASSMAIGRWILGRRCARVPEATNAGSSGLKPSCTTRPLLKFIRATCRDASAARRTSRGPAQ